VQRPIVVLTDASIRPEAAELLRPTCDVRVLEAYSSEEVMARACADAQGILARLGTVTGRVIDAARRLRIVARHGVGVDAVDLPAATARGIIVTTTGSLNAAAVSEYTFGLILALLRHVLRADAGMRAGKWERDPLVGEELEGQTIGIVGVGAIGTRVARHALGFGMKVIAHDPHKPPPEGLPVEMVSLPDLLARADIVTCHPRLNQQTNRMIDATAFAQMKPTAYLVNTSRGEVVDGTALIEALRTNRIRGAALDTFEEEPLAADSPLRTFPNVVLSPHVAGQTHAAVARVALSAAQSILDELAGRRPRYVYNPEAYEARGNDWPSAAV
jgi:D-3-phosphoglycerate dehydrogenase